MEENTVFEINDFTIVTDMEHFGAAFEGILQKYDLFGRRPSLPDVVKYKMTLTDSGFISIGENKLRVELFQPMPVSNEDSIIKELSKDDDIDDTFVAPFTAAEEIGNVRNGFDKNDGMTVKFGVRECIVISPNDSTCTLLDENQTNTIMGTIKTIMHSTRCEIPVFCYIKDKSLEMIEGYASDGNCSLNFASAALRNINRRHCSMSDLLHLFKEHLGVSTSAFHDEVRISSRFTHVVPLKHKEYCRLFTSDNLDNLISGPISTLPFDAFDIAATWRFFRENSLTENHNHSDFDINHSSYWNVKIKPSTKSLTGVIDEILGVYTDDRKKAIRSDLSCTTILGKHYTQKSMADAFQTLTVNSASDLSIGKGAEVAEEGTSGPVAPALVRNWVNYIFDEPAGSNVIQHFNALNGSRLLEKKWSDEAYEHNESLNILYNSSGPSRSDNIWAPYKSAKKGTTTWKLAVSLANARVFMTDEPRAEPQLWVEFLLRLRKKYERMENVELAINGIDHMQCAFSQKMQMLQLCIDARQKRHRTFDNAHSMTGDEFFDASEDFNDGASRDDAESLQSDSHDSHMDGRLKLAGMKLIGNPEQNMYIPITQDACPLTDEMIDAQNEHLFSLSEEDRVNVQMELVKSDMQSFKAANPGAVFADFLRWHSPKDYDEKTGTISERMLIPDNVWVKSWESAMPIPVSSQARIFNDTKIAEEILELFENATLDQVREWMKPTVFVAALERLTEVESIYGISDEKKKQRVRTAKILANATLNNSASGYAEISKYCSQVEMIHNMKVHLMQLFNDAKEVMHAPFPSEEDVRDAIKQLVNLAIWQIWNTPEEEQLETVFLVKPQDPIGRALAAMGRLDELTEQQLIRGDRKEYIFTWNLKRPSTTTVEMSHRMYADLRSDKHSLYFATSTDCNFFNASFLEQ